MRKLIPLHIAIGLRHQFWAYAIDEFMSRMDWMYHHRYALEEWWEQERRDIVGCYCMGGEL